jgi:hypothetical protein
MILFLIASLPLVFSFVVLLPWGSSAKAPRTLTLVSTFLKGMLVAFPGYLVILILRAIFGFNYDGFLLYLSLLLRDQLAPLLAALAGFFLLQRTLTFSATDEGIFLTAFAYLAGFLFIINVTDALRTWGEWDASLLFLVPTLRIGAVLLLSLLARRFYRWEGRDGVLFCAVAAGAAMVFALCCYFYAGNRLGWSITLAVAPVLAGVAVFAMRFPRVMRG